MKNTVQRYIFFAINLLMTLGFATLLTYFTQTSSGNAFSTILLAKP